PLKQLVSGSPNVLAGSRTDVKEKDKDCSSQDTLIPVYAASITFAIGVAIALVLHIFSSQVVAKGVLVSDHERCTALGMRVLHDRGSSVDAAITAALCLGVVHPHESGVGGGGVMLVHDIHKNKTRVIHFQGTAPKALKEEMLQNISEAGLQVGVPGLLRGLHHAHSLYGSLSWEDVVTRATAVAREGFNVSFSLAEAVSKVKGEQLSQRFRDMFFPDGKALRPGSFLKMPSLAGVLEAGLSNFYDGNFSQEMEDEVRVNGGVLTRDDISNYSVQCVSEFIIQVPPPPSAGAVLISALRLLQGFHLNENNNTENQTYHWIAQAMKAALAMASGLGDPRFNSSVTELLSDMLSKGQAEVLHQRIDSSAVHSLSHCLHSDINDFITRSGIILNSLILDFSWPNKTRGQLLTNQRNRVQPGKRPLSSLMPTIVVPTWHECGIYTALSSSGGQQSLSVIAQVLISVLSFHKEKNESLSLRRLQPKRLFVDSAFPEESVEFLHESSPKVQRVKTVQGILRNKDTITAITLPQLSDSLL
uniref:Gamma-glutamyltransferase 7 n=1 Tax=Dicentrarchus labrax TaxID=13489 RepID=A0A8C4E405_DICLA